MAGLECIAHRQSNNVLASPRPYIKAGLVCLQGLMSTLELLPMWGGAAPDVDLFFSGGVFDDDGEWAGGQTLEASAEKEGATVQFHWRCIPI